ncbi:probable protein phosphatase 2C 80 [Pyrus x bretschneideri]|uniref:probable protein phosphatase 2C 80 n=1 Tax=Pyrus x bretschneideri TaxID=225117 RepID=UPI00202F762B|nr:probable protein phosphatase 2C 80 [Pyrus x bretschneideri]
MDAQCLNINQNKFNSRLISVHVGPWLRDIQTSSSLCNATGAAHNLTFDGNSNDEQPANSTILSDQPKALMLPSGSCYLPHPDKEATGGEDAHFICEDAQAIGVADGVGGWADVGVNAGFFSCELMSHSVRAIQEEPEGCFNPVRVLKKAHSCTKSKGSSTACIIGLKEKVCFFILTNLSCRPL